MNSVTIVNANFPPLTRLYILLLFVVFFNDYNDKLNFFIVYGFSLPLQSGYFRNFVTQITKFTFSLCEIAKNDRAVSKTVRSSSHISSLSSAA